MSPVLRVSLARTLLLVRRSLIAAISLLSACGGDAGPTPPAPEPASLSISAGTGQSAASGNAVPVAPAVVVRDAQGRGLAGVTVQFAVTAGGGAVEGATPTTDAAGVARVTRWTLGPSGDQRLAAHTGSLTPVTFQATIQSGNGAVEVTVPSGGTFEITTPDHPYRGFRLTARPGALPSPGRWEMVVPANPAHLPLPASFRVAGPILRVTTATPRAAGLLLLDIPVTVPTGSAVVIAIRDPLRGVMEVLPTLSRTATSVRVATTHLRGDLLPGPGASSAIARGSGAGETIADLIPIELPTPLPDVAPTLNPLSDRWPVLEYGSYPEPEGHGIAIPLLTVLNTLTAGPPLSEFVRVGSQPGFYADGAPLAAVVSLAQMMTDAEHVVLDDLDQQLDQIGKPLRDRYLLETTTANLALQGPTIVVVAKRSARKRVYATAYSTGARGTSVTTITPGQLAPSSHLFTEASGFAAHAVPTTADGPTVTSTGLVPLTSSVIPYERARLMLANLHRLVGADPEQRATLSETMSAEAGLPPTDLDLQVSAEGGWQRVAHKKIVLRTRKGSLQIIPAGDATMHHRVGGTTISNATAGLFNLDSPGLNDLPPQSPREITIARQRQMLQGLRQMSAATFSLMRAPFEVTPDEVPLPSDRTISLTPAIPEPPAEGFRVRWAWGDETTTETTSLAAATHTYDTADDYQVIATLLTPAGVVLAVDTVAVRSTAIAAWRIVSLSDPDDMFDEVETSGNEAQLLQRLIQAPTSGLIVVEQIGSEQVLRLRVRRSNTWGPHDCCPIPPYSGLTERVLPLGFSPERSHPVGPHFAGWGTSFWNQSTETLDAGTIMGQYAMGTAPYKVKNGGTQTGPAGGIRIVATRNGTAMTGEMVVYIWFTDDDTGDVDPGPTFYRLPFTAVRMR